MCTYCLDNYIDGGAYCCILMCAHRLLLTSGRLCELDRMKGTPSIPVAHFTFSSFECLSLSQSLVVPRSHSIILRMGVHRRAFAI